MLFLLFKSRKKDAEVVDVLATTPGERLGAAIDQIHIYVYAYRVLDSKNAPPLSGLSPTRLSSYSRERENSL